MTDELPDPRRILDETDWSTLTHGAGPAAPETPVKLERLVLDHLYDDLLHQGSLYSATGPAARYVAALLAGSRPLTPAVKRSLLGWLAEVAGAVSNAQEEKIRIWFDHPAVDRVPFFAEIRGLRPQLYRGVAACLDDDDPTVRRAALFAAVPLLDDPDLVAHRERLIPALADEPELRASLAVWRGEAATTVTDADLWTDDTNRDRGPLDEPPF